MWLTCWSFSGVSWLTTMASKRTRSPRTEKSPIQPDDTPTTKKIKHNEAWHVARYADTDRFVWCLRFFALVVWGFARWFFVLFFFALFVWGFGRRTFELFCVGYIEIVFLLLQVVREDHSSCETHQTDKFKWVAERSRPSPWFGRYCCGCWRSLSHTGRGKILSAISWWGDGQCAVHSDLTSCNFLIACSCPRWVCLLKTICPLVGHQLRDSGIPCVLVLLLCWVPSIFSFMQLLLIVS